jgi:hypothetical protein
VIATVQPTFLYLLRDSIHNFSSLVSVGIPLNPARLTFTEGEECNTCCNAPILTSLYGCAKPRARDISPLYSPSLHLNLTHPHPVRTPSPHRYSPILPGCANPRSRGYRERQLLARRIQGCQSGLQGTVIWPWYRNRLPNGK